MMHAKSVCPPGPEENIPMIKRASLVYFYMGDSYLTTLAQETVPLHLAMDDYDRSILLKFDTNLGMFDLSSEAEKSAHLVMDPTRENLAKALRDLASDGYEIDLFVFSHGFRNGGIMCSNGKEGDNALLGKKWLEKEFENEKLPIRMVHSIACWGNNMSPTWIKLGAKASVGTKSVNFYPTRFTGFIKNWSSGDTLANAAHRSNTKLVRTPVQAYIQANALCAMNEWHTSGLGFPNILGRGKSAEAYFREMWIDDEWTDGITGKQNMNLSSTYIISGDRRLLKN